LVICNEEDTDGRTTGQGYING